MLPVPLIRLLASKRRLLVLFIGSVVLTTIVPLLVTSLVNARRAPGKRFKFAALFERVSESIWKPLERLHGDELRRPISTSKVLFVGLNAGVQLRAFSHVLSTLAFHDTGTIAWEDVASAISNKANAAIVNLSSGFFFICGLY